MQWLDDFKIIKQKINRFIIRLKSVFETQKKKFSIARPLSNRLAKNGGDIIHDKEIVANIGEY